MPMLFLLQQYQEVILILLKKLLKKNLLYISIFYPLGEQRLLGGVGWLTTAAWVTPRIFSNLGS
jgi:hypothetical protein